MCVFLLLFIAIPVLVPSFVYLMIIVIKKKVCNYDDSKTNCYFYMKNLKNAWYAKTFYF